MNDQPSHRRADVSTVETDVLIVGAGPTGASLACFLASHGITGTMISKDPSTCATSRANYINMAAFECLRDVGLEQAALRMSNPASKYGIFHTISKSLAGDELLRGYALGNDPNRAADYAAASPCMAANLPQQDLEPVLVTRAMQNGYVVKFSTQLVRFEQRESDGIVESLIEDTITHQRMLVRSRYLFGADGASSLVAGELDLPFVSKPTGSLSINVEFEGDLSHLMADKPGIIHILTRPDKPQPAWGMAAILRSIRPWHQWTMVLMCHPSISDQRIDVSVANMMARVREFINDDHVELRYKQHTFWRVYERYAEHYSHGNVFCLGDAVHQHPPYNGLGANTCIQDAFNLAWKVAYVLRGKAGSSLLSSYSKERQPIGKHTVQRANDTGRMFQNLFGVLGVFEPEPTSRLQRLDLFKADTEEGEAARAEFRQCRYDMEEELNCLGSEMNQWYQSSAISTADEREEDMPAWPTTMRGRSLNYIESTYPGFRVPHVWVTALKTKVGGGASVTSIRDLCGHGKFTLLTGVGGKASWSSAAKMTFDKLDIEIQVYGIGWGQDYEDTFSDWYKKRDVQETGAVLVRPDRTVAWRCKKLAASDSVSHKLLSAIKAVLW